MKTELHTPPRILILDKDEDDFRFFREAISEVSARIPVSCCSDADRLLEVVAETRPSLIFIEYRLHRENGIECVRRLKAHPDFHSIPVVLWGTGNVRPVVGAAYRAGIQLYVEKPWDINVWVKEIKMIIRRNYRQLSFYSSPAQVPVKA